MVCNSRAYRMGTLMLVASACMYVACASEDPAAHEGADEEPSAEFAQLSQPLSASDPISLAVGQSCTTSVLKNLSLQLVAEIECLRPRTLTKIDRIPNTTLGIAVLPYLQTAAVAPLTAAAKVRKTPMAINSALRTLAQQYLLYRWYQTGRCGISLAALAVDVDDNVGWRTAFTSNGFRWLGANDPVHYDYLGGGVSLRGLSVRAFQRLWNRNNPKDKLVEDGIYGDGTASRLAKSPVGGFPVGAVCDAPSADAGADASAADGGDAGSIVPEPPPPELPQEPDAPEPAPDAAVDSGCGCRMTTNESATRNSTLFGFAAFGLAMAARRRKRA
jgi:MYXO-CTERM domain-containing protein